MYLVNGHGHSRAKGGERGDTRPVLWLSRLYSPQTWSEGRVEGAGTSSGAHICALDGSSTLYHAAASRPAAAPRARARGPAIPFPSLPFPSLPRRLASMASLRAMRDALCAARLGLSTRCASAVAAHGHACACAAGRGWGRGRVYPSFAPHRLFRGAHTGFASLRALQARAERISTPPPSLALLRSRRGRVCRRKRARVARGEHPPRPPFPLPHILPPGQRQERHWREQKFCSRRFPSFFIILLSIPS